MNPTAIAAWAGALGTVVAAVTLLYMIRSGRRHDFAEQQKAMQEFADRQNAPVKGELETTRRDRDYWRNRADQFEDELRRRGGTT